MTFKCTLCCTRVLTNKECMVLVLCVCGACGVERGRASGCRSRGRRSSTGGRAMEQLKRLLIVVSQGGRLSRKLNRSLTEDHPTYQQQHQRDPVEDVQDQLWRILKSVKPRPRPLPGYQSAPRGTPEDRQAIGIDCDEVYPGIFVGDM